jgi:hypothetical protein
MAQRSRSRQPLTSPTCGSSGGFDHPGRRRTELKGAFRDESGWARTRNCEPIRPSSWCSRASSMRAVISRGQLDTRRNKCQGPKWYVLDSYHSGADNRNGLGGSSGYSGGWPVRDFGSKQSSTLARDEQAAAAGPGPGKRTLTEMLTDTSQAANAPVQRKVEAGASVMHPRLRPTIFELFGAPSPGSGTPSIQTKRDPDAVSGRRVAMWRSPTKAGRAAARSRRACTKEIPTATTNTTTCIRSSTPATMPTTLIGSSSSA